MLTFVRRVKFFVFVISSLIFPNIASSDVSDFRNVTFFESRRLGWPLLLDELQTIFYSSFGFFTSSDIVGENFHAELLPPNKFSSFGFSGLVGASSGLPHLHIRGWIERFVPTLDLKLYTIGMFTEQTFFAEEIGRKAFLFGFEFDPRFTFYGKNIAFGLVPSVRFTDRLFISSHSYFVISSFAFRSRELFFHLSPNIGFIFDRTYLNPEIPREFISAGNSLNFSLSAGIQPNKGIWIIREYSLEFGISYRYIFDRGNRSRSFLQNPLIFSPAIKLNLSGVIVLNLGADISPFGSENIGEAVARVFPLWSVYFGASFIGGGGQRLKVISGQVLDEELKPVEGVIVSSSLGQSFITDKQGNFKIVVPAGVRNIELKAIKDGYEEANGIVSPDKTVKLVIKKEEKFSLISGEIRNVNGSVVSGAEVVVEELGKKAQADILLGSFELRLPRGQYNLSFSAPGYQKKRIPVEVKEGENLRLSVVLIPAGSAEAPNIMIEKDVIVLRQGIVFDRKEGRLLRASYPILSELSEFLKENGTLKVSVEVHVDSGANPDADMKTTEKVAREIIDFLVQRGIDRSRLFPKGMGSREPIASNEYPEERLKNRRVIFRIIER